MLFSAELPVWFSCVQENGFLGVPENCSKNRENPRTGRNPLSEEGLEGGCPSPGGQLARPGRWPCHQGAWVGPTPSGALPGLLLLPETEKPQKRSHFSNSRRGAATTLCSSPGELI